MSVKAALVRYAIKWTPNALIIWGANLVLKGVAQLSEFAFDLDGRRVFVRVTLAGEREPIELAVEDFSVIGDQTPYRFLIKKATSNRLWLDNLLARVTNRPLTIPDLPQLRSHVGLVSELLGPK